MTLKTNKYNPTKDLEITTIPHTFNSDKLNKPKIAILDIFFQCIANEIKEQEELIILNL